MGRKIVSLALALILSFYGIITHTCLGLSHNGFKVYINPQNNSARVGHTFSINMTISNVSSPGLWAYEFKLYYNKSLLEPLSTEIPADHFLKPTFSPDGLFIISPGTVNESEGTVSFAATLVGSEPGKTGSGTLANITFVVITSGTSPLTIGGYTTSEPKFVDGNGNKILSSSYTLVDGYVEGLPPPPPTIPPPSPTPGKQTLMFNFEGIYGYLTFPEECRPNHVITYELIVTAEPDGIYLNYFKLNISCNTSTGQKTLYNETIENQDLPESWLLNKTIALEIPADAYGKVHCVIEAEMYKRFAACHCVTELYTTYIRIMTYQELQAAYEGLLNQHNATVKELERWITEYQKLNSTYYELSNLYNTTIAQLLQWQNQYQKLNNTYNQLLQDYSSLSSNYQTLQINYSSLKSSYDSLEETYCSLNSSYNSLKENYDSLLSRCNDLGEKYNSLNLTYQELSLNYTTLIQSFVVLENNLTSLQAKYENLSTSYDSLNSTYHNLLKEFETLESKREALVRELWLTRVLWFIFLGIAIAAVVYVAYSMRKKQG